MTSISLNNNPIESKEVFDFVRFKLDFRLTIKQWGVIDNAIKEYWNNREIGTWISNEDNAGESKNKLVRRINANNQKMETLLILFFYIYFSILVGIVGKNRRIGFGPSFVFSLIFSPSIGLIIALFSKKNSYVNQVPKYRQYQELAQKEEFKGNVDQAIDFYMDSLYYLQNDYPNLKKNSKIIQKNKIAKLKLKIDELKNKRQVPVQNC